MKTENCNSTAYIESIDEELESLREILTSIRIESQIAKELSLKAQRLAESHNRRITRLERRISLAEQRLVGSSSFIDTTPIQQGHRIKGRFVTGRKSTGFKDNSKDQLPIYFGSKVFINRYTQGTYAYKTEGIVVETDSKGRSPAEGRLFIKVEGVDEPTQRTVRTLKIKQDE